MDKVIVFSENLRFEKKEDIEINNIYSREKLAHILVSEENIRCLIAELPEMTYDYIKFFSSVKTNFPMLETAVITSDRNRKIQGYKIINSNEEGYTAEAEKFIIQSENKNKRDSNRFSWPLTAWFSDNDGEKWNELEIFSISASGSYLKTDSIFPKGGTSAKIRIIFANFSLESDCRVVDSMSRSSNYPFGFSIRFTTISEEGKIVLNRLINDAVIKILMEPESEPGIPSLEGDEFAPDFTFI